MKKSKLVSVILVMVLSLSLIFVAKDVFAATDLTNSFLSGDINTADNTSIGTSLSNTSTSNSLTNAIDITNTINTTNSVLMTNNTTSTYNNTTLPKTGVEDSMPAVILVVVLGISAVYAYKKVQEYKNI